MQGREVKINTKQPYDYPDKAFNMTNIDAKGESVLAQIILGSRRRKYLLI